MDSINTKQAESVINLIFAARCYCQYGRPISITSPPKSNLGRMRRYPPRRRMYSPAACASCTMCNVTEPLLNVTEPYGSVVDRYEKLRERYGAVTENIDFAHH